MAVQKGHDLGESPTMFEDEGRVTGGSSTYVPRGEQWCL